MAFSFFSDIKAAILDLLSSVEQTVSDVLNIKEIAQEEFKQLEADFDEATKDFEDFEERVKSLRTKVIRADIAFELVDNLRKVNFRSFKDQIAELKTSVLDNVGEFVKEAQDVGAAKTVGPITAVSKIIGFIRGIGTAWKLIAFVTHALRAIPPIADQMVKELHRLESIVMQQTKPERKKIGPHRTRRV